MGNSATKEEDKEANKQKEPMVTSSKRKICYEHRDRYYDCVREAGREEAVTKCAKLRAEYEKYCLKSWVKYFDDMNRNQKYIDAEKQMMKTRQPPRLTEADLEKKK
mmetsp:Transcript_1676/g.5059  ORF Transcript_1676/g.5059 Transcript_1676/m.5059 type:complete len:106 (+) Transcript_1676:154-471(+)